MTKLPILLYIKDMTSINSLSHKNKVTINLSASTVIDKEQLYATARRLRHTTCYHRYGSTIEFYIPDMYYDKFTNRAKNNGLDVLI